MGKNKYLCQQENKINKKEDYDDMYNIIRQGDTDQYDLMSYICNNLVDIETLPADCGACSTCIVIENSYVWMLGTDKKWHEI